MFIKRIDWSNSKKKSGNILVFPSCGGVGINGFRREAAILLGDNVLAASGLYAHSKQKYLSC